MSCSHEQRSLVSATDLTAQHVEVLRWARPARAVSMRSAFALVQSSWCPRVLSVAVWRHIDVLGLIKLLHPTGLHSESLALVDMLVLIQSRKFVGFDMSTLSWCAERKGSKA